MNIKVKKHLHFESYISQILTEDRPLILTGIGARKCPADITNLITLISYKLGNRFKLILRSGNAIGSDKIFEDTLKNTKSGLEIYTAYHYKVRNPKVNKDEKPGGLWREFDNKLSDEKDEREEYKSISKRYLKVTWSLATDIARKHHPIFDRLNIKTKRLLIRNTFQILGLDLQSKSDLVLCYTKDGVEHGDLTTRETGGTGTAIRIATSYSVPIFNLGNERRNKELMKFVEES